METIGDHWIIEELEKLRRKQNPAKYPPKEAPYEQPSLPADDPGGLPPPDDTPRQPDNVKIDLN